MVYTSIEIIAIIIIAAAVIKMVFLAINAKGYMNFAKGFYKSAGIAQLIGVIIAAIVLYYLNQAGITIVQILAVMAFLAGILVVGLAPHLEDLIKKYEGQIKRGHMWKENWLYILIWIALLVWGVKELFFM